MVSGRVLQGISALHDLPQLVAALGHEPLWEPVDPHTLDLGRRSDPPLEAAIVGRLGGFRWYAVKSRRPTHAAPRLARQLAARGRICGIFGLGTERRQLVVSVGFGGTPVLEVDLEHPGHLAASCLARIGQAQTGGSLGIASRAAEALTGAGVGHRFFTAFRATLDRIMGALPPAIPARHRHELALLQLTRVLFLYFVQAKGWLDGSDQFLRRHVDDCLFHRRRIHRHLLLPLFFGTLNQPAARRSSAARSFGAIPFLNGGLFEPHRLERAHRPDIPDEAWRDAFDTLFERYHFVVGADTPGCIAPDMLGRVFEGVMDPEARRQTGTYYTPDALVRSLVDAALAGFVAGRLGCSGAEALRRLASGDSSAVRVIERATVLDPAVGSGAFLLGALERLLRFRRAAALPCHPREVVARQLYGVDLNPAAVRLAELRLWLAIIAAEPDGSPEAVDPLPNLDAFVRQGDSLSDPLRLALRHPLRASRNAPALAEARRSAAGATGAAKREALARLRRIETATATERLDAAIIEREVELRRLISCGKELTLFGVRRGLDREARRAVTIARESLRSLRGMRRALRESGAVPSFDFDIQFGDVMAAGGFDLIIGNPPWVRAESLPAPVRRQLRERFRWWRAGSGRGYAHQPDLSVAFLERAWELTRSGGIVAMLVPAKLATAAYASTLRAALAERGTILSLSDLTNSNGAEFDATAYPLALVARTERAAASHRPSLGLDPGSRAVLERLPSGGAPWILHSGGLQRALASLERFPRLADTLRVHLGVKSGANHLFLEPGPEIEAGLVRPALHGKDIRAFRAAPSGRIVWTHDAEGRPLRALPPGAARHFALHEAALRARVDDDGNAPWTLFRPAAGCARPRVAWPDLAPRLEAACLVGAESGRIIPLNSCYLVILAASRPALALTAWLNSTWIRAAARVVTDPASGGYARFNARAVGGIPLPPRALEDARLAAIARRGAAGEALQHQLDTIVGAWLGLEERDRRLLAGVVGVGAERRR
ncbi:MAG TPA: N-6 DNA methylase [Gemmatimonadales bacterium]|nr:N-6 DNA methylase [Gemmatimonadales bacterium]